MVSTSSTTPGTPSPPTGTPSRILVRPPACTKDRILLHHIMEAPPHGHRRVDLHLGQKPKLGGRYAGITHSLHITIAGHLYILVSLLLVVSLSVIFISVGSYFSF